jgi:enediyne biosynthesis protein E4
MPSICRMLARALAAGLLCVGLVTCKSDETPPAADAGPDGLVDGATDGGLPPKICKTPKKLGTGPYFKDVTSTWKLDSTHLGVLGNRLTSVDINEDGYPDLFVTKVCSNCRDKGTAASQRNHFVLLNVANGTGRAFKDVTVSSGFTAIRGGGTGRSSQLVVFADINNDGHVDAFSGTYVDASSTADPSDPGDRNEALLGDGKGNFKLATKSALYHDDMYTTTSASFLDYDRDGLVDLWVGFGYEIYGYIYANQDRLYKGAGDGTFTEVTDKMGLTTNRASGWTDGTASIPTYGVTACDIDGDGDQDLLANAYGRQWNMLWRNDGTKFTNISKESKYYADDNEDYSDNEFYKCYCKTSGKCTAGDPVISCGNYWTPGVDDQDWRQGGNTFTTVCGDIDNDGDMDLFLAAIHHWHIGKSSDPSQLLINPGKSPLVFERPGNDKMGLARTHTSTEWNEGDITAAFFDFDGDGLQDIILMDSDYPGCHTWLFHQKSDHTFEEIGNKAGIDHDRGQEVTIADFDGDGDLDVVIATSTMRADSSMKEQIAQVHLYENLVGNNSNWLKVKLVGSGKGGANRSGIGAWVKATAGGKTQLRELQGGHGHFGLEHDLVLQFGLDASCEVSKLEVRWPDSKNTKMIFTDVRANYLVEIDQKTGTLRYVK